MKKIESIRILVVGDIMLDKYVVGEVERISPEAPVPIVKVTEEYATLGGCGNVVRNICELGSQVFCASSIANDEAGRTVIDQLSKVGAHSLLVHQSKTTIVKERIIADQRHVQMIRIDREKIEDLDHKPFIEAIEEYRTDYDMIIVSDYGKGMITNKLMNFLHTLKAPIIVDPIPKNQHNYGEVFMITPNEKEAAQMGSKILLGRAEYVLETKGKKGMILYEKDDIFSISADEVDVYNVSGAGDTVVAVMAVCLSMGLNPLEAAEVANKCAGYVVTQSGTSTVPKNIFMNNLGMYYTQDK